jgi:hypothetical protein
MIQLYRNLIQLYRAGKNDLPSGLARTYRGRIVEVGPANATTRCGRCNRTYHDHLWILVDSDDPEQGGVIDCAGVN